MAVDLIKKYNALDLKNIEKETEKMRDLISTGMYPSRLTFPMTLQFELTTRCNVYCKHCYNDSGNNCNEDAMTPQRWIDFAKYLVSKGGIFECILSGGEPLLLGNDLFNIMDVLHDDGTCFLLITNGYLLSKDYVQRLSKYRYKWLQISIDGSDPEYHDAFRQRKGTWEHAVNGALMVSGAGIPLTIAHCITPGNLKKIDEMCDLAYQLGASNIILGEVNLSGRSEKNKEILLNEEQRAIMYERYEYNLMKYAGRMTVQRSAGTRYSVLRYLSSPNSGLIIRPNGDMRLDCMAPFVIGNVLSDDFQRVWVEKANTCWEHPLVKEYVDSFNAQDISEMMLNYVDKDIYI